MIAPIGWLACGFLGFVMYASQVSWSFEDFIISLFLGPISLVLMIALILWG